ncbi:hypothetical protein FGADI_687 [Fusarium gaditjirri]|uniref:Uncharacterized protein n=1 Tax=Fusarium gaditjirri TaxID=282569 RepID=A0A8H4TN66_9HYPO|nr:hypothetical protein FGADI_687 [Fusarium gaditjirri]
MPEADDGSGRKGLTVAASANQCLQSFQKCLVSASMINPRELSMIEDQVARFSSWGASTGVFAPGSASMDHRLRYAPEVHSVVTGLLESLNYQCQECLGILTTILESIEAGEGYVPAEEFPKSLNEIAAEISRLNKISNTIRRASKDTQALAASKFYIKDDEGNNVEETLLDNFKHHINDRFPALGEIIQERLARTMLLRRKQILYRRHRQESVYTKAQDTIPAVSITFPTAKAVVSLAQPKPKQPKANSAVSKPATTTPSQIRSATTLAPEKFKIAASTPSVISASKTIAFHSHESLVFPPAPGHALKKRYEQLKSQRLAEHEQSLNSKKSEASQKPTVQELLANDLQSLGEIACPYCLCALPAEEAFDEKTWQNHVKNDLDAYVCIFEDCDQPEVLYNHSDQWLSHLQQHRRFWRCPSHRDLEPFSSGEDYIAHMREVHSSKLSDKQLRVMANKSSRKIPQLFPSCPLCGKEESNINGRVEDHLAGHLRYLALKSLPSYHENIPDDNEDANDSIDVSRPKSRSTVRDLREDRDYVPQSIFTSQHFWDRWNPPLVQAPWLNFLDQVYEDLDLTVNDASSFFDTFSFQDLPNTFENDRIIQHILKHQEMQQGGNNENNEDRNVLEPERTSDHVEPWPRDPPGFADAQTHETSRAARTPNMAEVSSFHVSPDDVVAESSERFQIEISNRYTRLASIPESSGLRQDSIASETDDESIYQAQARHSGSSAGTVYVNGQRVSPLYEYNSTHSYLPTAENDRRFSAHSPPVPAPPANTPNSYHDVGISASSGTTVIVDERTHPSRRRRPIIVDNKRLFKRPVRIEGDVPYTKGDNPTTRSEPFVSGDEMRRWVEEAEKRVSLKIAEANAEIAARPIAPAPPNLDIYRNMSSRDLSDERERWKFDEERREDNARRIARREAQKEAEKEAKAQLERAMKRLEEETQRERLSEQIKEEEAQRERLRERMIPRRRLMVGGGSRRRVEYSEPLYRYEENKPDGNGESSEQKDKPNAFS